MNPFATLDLPQDCDDAQVRRAWQLAVQANPPETNAERFQAVQEAWKCLETETSRWIVRFTLPAGSGAGPLRALAEYLRLTGRARPVGAAALREWIAACAETDDSRRAGAVGLKGARLAGPNRKGARKRR